MLIISGVQMVQKVEFDEQIQTNRPDSECERVTGKLLQTVKLPDTITSWDVSAFAINSNGIYVMRQPTSVTGFRFFFVTLTLPTSVKRGEIFQLQVTVFNYRKSDVKAIVALHESPEFVVLGGTIRDGWYETATWLKAESATIVKFRMGLVQAGLVLVKVKATDQADGYYDQVHRNLLIKHDGQQYKGLITELMSVKDENEGVAKMFDIPWPLGERISDGSQSVKVKITGDVFGQALSNLDSLVNLPTGCGEQTMIGMAPNVFGLYYIDSKELKGFETIVKEMKYNMKAGRLTAFVVKCFSRAAEYITVDERIIFKGIKFLMSRMEPSGAFSEKGKIVHQEFLRFRESISNEVNKAFAYLVKEINSQGKDTLKPKTKASTAYAFSLLPQHDSEKKKVFMSLLDDVQGLRY
ncbi:alpha-2-macroglobulin [Plakobranchus ocellatus]|uniref:Alpha-2-macroglobulin n=1 Tax=Plakobranchus ocellatus TaxID=259542 RepID=A0AAV3ZCP3_9GAST|nr:alpha-2-macroglobulin [Plakobranchus ocellatus]